MRYSNQREILLCKYSRNDVRREELVKWLVTTAQSVIGQQDKKTKKIYLGVLKETPAIYMS